MKNLSIFIIVLIVFLLFLSAILLYWFRAEKSGSYYAVYLKTGDIYFGKLSHFPKLSLSDVYFLRQDPQNQQNPLSIPKFRDAFWGPEDKLYLNEENVVWKVKLREDSELLKIIKSK